VPESTSETRPRLTGRLMARNAAWNVIGTAAPLAVAIWAIPFLIHGMGAERFGLLAIIWAGIGYFTLFDLGTGRALTKLVAERLGNEREAELPALLHTGMALMYALGTVAALLLAAVTPYVVRTILNVPASLEDEARWSLLILALTLPFVVSTAGLVGILQAHQLFKHINIIRVILGLITFLGPVIALLITPSLTATTLVLAAARVAAWLAYRTVCRDSCAGFAPTYAVTRAAARDLLSFGGWITVSNIVGPLMVYLDRFVIGSLLTMTAVAYYTVPYEVITRLWIIPEAITAVLFPAFSASLVSDPSRASMIFFHAGRILLCVMFVPLGLAMLFAPEALLLWLGADFARESTAVVRWLAIGVFINSIARLPYTALQGAGRPDLTAKLHLAEVPIYAVLLVGLMHVFGIAGAAAAWTLRIAADAAALFIMSMRFNRGLGSVQRQTVLLTSGATVLLAVCALPSDLWLKTGLALILVILGVALSCYHLLAIRAGKGNGMATSRAAE
jgi:O-antigen/teichoic acid export membrane protein